MNSRWFVSALLMCIGGVSPSLIAQQTYPSQNDPSVLRRQQEIQAANVPGSKTVRLERYTSDDPIRVVGLYEGDRDVTATPPFRTTNGKPFVAGEDWIKNLKVIIKNVSNKEVLSGSLRISFPETGSGSAVDPVVAESRMIGQMPEHYARNGKKLEARAGDQPLNLGPNQELTVEIGPIYERIQASVESKRQMSTITTCLVQLNYFYFADGTRWTPYNFQKPDPSNNGNYMNIRADEFRSTTPVN